MLRLKENSAPFPQRYPKVERKLATVKEKGWVKVDGKELRSDVDYMPQQGLQEYMQTQEIDLLLLGGQPGGGKTMGLILAALDGVENPKYGALIIKKQLISTKAGSGGIVEDCKRVYLPMRGVEFSQSDNPTFSFPSGATVSLTHANFSAATEKGLHEAQEKAKNFQNSFLAIDEATDHEWEIFTYFQSRNRDASGKRSRMILTFNTNSHHWTRVLIDPWIMTLPDGRGVMNPDMVEKVKYCLIKGESPRDIVWGDSRSEVVKKANITVPKDLRDIGVTPEDMVKSVCFRECDMAENRILMSATKGKHAANVYNLGETESRKLFDKDWNAEEIERCSVSKQMIKNIWSNPYAQDTTMMASLDVSSGGDNSTMVIWKGLTIIAIEDFIGSDPKELENWIHIKLREYGVDPKLMAFDATGIGNYLKGYTEGYPITSNMRPIQEYDKYGNPVTMEQYFNVRSQLMAKTQYLFESGQISCTVDMYKKYPHGRTKTMKPLVDILCEEIDVFRVTQKSNKIYYKSKLEFKDRFGYSPDRMDAIIYHAALMLDARDKKEGQCEYTEDDYNGLYIEAENSFDYNSFS
jgi:hypothetical protein